MDFRSAVSVRFLFFTLFSAAYAVSADGAERAVLLDFKYNLSDPAGFLSGWDPAADHCTWPFISCDIGGRVVAINISAPEDGDPFIVPCSRSRRFRRRCFDHPSRRLAGRLSSAIGELAELRFLSLPFHGLYGEIPWEIWRLENLEVLDLEGSSLIGSLPSIFPRTLRALNLASNLIAGEIPPSLSRCVHLEILDLSGNQMEGTIPGFVGKFLKLRRLDLSFNRLKNSIPDEIGAGCLSLERLDLSGNMLIGSIPRSLGNCSELRSLLLFSNLLDDVIPSDLGRLRKLQVLDLSRNSLSGFIPEELGNCKELAVIVLLNLFDPMMAMSSSSYVARDEFNYFQGGISEKITALPKLRILWAPRGNLEGEFPRNWGACESLEMVNLAQNRFSGEISTTFGRCKNINFFDLSLNKLIGQLSEEMPVPCMAFFDVSGNNFSGSIPEFTYEQCPTLSSFPTDDLVSSYSSFFISRSFAEIALPSFDANVNVSIYHNFGRNNFTGNLSSLPVGSDRFGHNTVYSFRVDENFIRGSLTDGIFGKCRQLGGLVVNFSNNLVSGELPADIGFNCKALIILNAANNHIRGIIPASIGLLDSLVGLDLSMNQLKGHIIAGLTGLKRLKYLRLANNNLSGKIPAGFSQLLSLEVLDLSSNCLSGEIPRGLVNLGNLSVLLLNNNKLCGKVPSGFVNVTSLSMLNISFNNLSGPLLLNSSMMRCNRFRGNPLLQACHDVSLSIPLSYLQGHAGDTLSYIDYPSPPLPPSTKNNDSFSSIEIASVASAAAIVAVLLALIVLYVYTMKCVPSSSVQSSERREVTIFVDIGVPLTYETVVRAAGNFNASNCIGSGGFGATYKAEISPGIIVAIKRLAVGRCQGVQQFHAEIKILGRWRHPNLVTLIGYHVSDAEMFLIYNYLPGGNLERFLHERPRRGTEWTMLYKIALDVAQALAYLHDHCVPHILHRDVKPSNILLDNEFNAYLSDFGLARILGNSETHATTGVAGTFGYVAPEYAMTSRVSDKADVYSYGVVLLELLSDKKALDPSFSPYGNGFNIVAWASMLLEESRADEFFADGLWLEDSHHNLIETLKLAIRCTEEQLYRRPSMKHVVRRLKELQSPA